MILTKVTIDLWLLIVLAILAGIVVLTFLIILGFSLYIRISIWYFDLYSDLLEERNLSRNHIPQTERKDK